MYDNENVNSGYLNQDGFMKHFYLKNGSSDVVSIDESNVIIDRNDGEYDIDTFNRFGTLHKIKNLNLEERFEMVNNHTRVLTFTDEDNEIKQEFMYFIAPLFENVDGYFDFDRVEASLQDGVVIYALYADDTHLDMLNNNEGLFATAKVRNIDNTRIPVVESYLSI